jgi:hypothetical protein
MKVLLRELGAALIMLAAVIMCHAQQSATLMGLPQYGVILTGSPDTPEPVIVDGKHKSILAYAIDQEDANGHGPIREVLATMNVRLNIHHALAISSEHEPMGKPSRPVTGEDGPVVRAVLVLVIFDDGQIVGPDAAGSAIRFTTRINAERAYAQELLAHPETVWQHALAIMSARRLPAFKTFDDSLVFHARQDLARDMVNTKNEHGEAAGLEVAHRAASLPVLWKAK